MGISLSRGIPRTVQAHTVRAMRPATTTSTRTATTLGDRARTTLRHHWRDIVAVAVALVFFSVAWPTFFVTHDLWVVLVPLLAALGSLPVAVTRHLPFATWVCVTAACAIAVPLHTDPGLALGWPVVFHLALAICLASVILTERAGRVVLAVAGSTALMAFNPGLDVSVGWMIGALVFSAVLLLVRWLVASRRQLRTSHVELARESERSSEQADLRVLAEERNRLARDLHDVVAHQMSMIVVQSQSAPYRLRGVTPAVHAEFDSLAGTAREALDEVRGLLGVLRVDEDTPSVDPVGADQIEPTLQRARQAGVDITWQITGDLDRIDETAGVVLHRVLQESLANASRHAPGGLVVVTLDAAPSDDDDGPPSVALEVDSGPAAPDALIAPGVGGGSGIPGMSARVRAVGGTFSAVPAADGGFTVSATVPVRGVTRPRSRLG